MFFCTHTHVIFFSLSRSCSIPFSYSHSSPFSCSRSSLSLASSHAHTQKQFITTTPCSSHRPPPHVHHLPCLHHLLSSLPSHSLATTHPSIYPTITLLVGLSYIYTVYLVYSGGNGLPLVVGACVLRIFVSDLIYRMGSH